MVNYLLADMLSKINIGLKSKLPLVKILRSKFVINLLIFLYKEGVIRGFSYSKKKYFLDIFLKFVNNRPIIFNLKLVSKPGRRVYMKSEEIKKKYGLNTIVVISTSKGLITNRDLYFKKINIGGEILFEYGLI